MFWSEIGSGFGEPGGTPLPKIPRSIPPPPGKSVVGNNSSYLHFDVRMIIIEVLQNITPGFKQFTAVIPTFHRYFADIPLILYRCRVDRTHGRCVDRLPTDSLTDGRLLVDSVKCQPLLDREWTDNPTDKVDRRVSVDPIVHMVRHFH